MNEKFGSEGEVSENADKYGWHDLLTLRRGDEIILARYDQNGKPIITLMGKGEEDLLLSERNELASQQQADQMQQDRDATRKAASEIKTGI